MIVFWPGCDKNAYINSSTHVAMFPSDVNFASICFTVCDPVLCDVNL